MPPTTGPTIDDAPLSTVGDCCSREVVVLASVALEAIVESVSLVLSVVSFALEIVVDVVPTGALVVVRVVVGGGGGSDDAVVGGSVVGGVQMRVAHSHGRFAADEQFKQFESYIDCNEHNVKLVMVIGSWGTTPLKRFDWRSSCDRL